MPRPTMSQGPSSSPSLLLLLVVLLLLLLHEPGAGRGLHGRPPVGDQIQVRVNALAGSSLHLCVCHDLQACPHRRRLPLLHARLQLLALS